MINDFLVVDDDEINNMICRRMINKLFPMSTVREFIDPEAALYYIKTFHASENASDAVVFLDINMPMVSGWEFLDAFEKFNTVIKEHLKIYMLSSSVDVRDKERAAHNINVMDYIEKPLSVNILSQLLKKHLAL